MLVGIFPGTNGKHTLVHVKGVGNLWLKPRVKPLDVTQIYRHACFFCLYPKSLSCMHRWSILGEWFLFWSPSKKSVSRLESFYFRNFVGELGRLTRLAGLFIDGEVTLCTSFLLFVEAFFATQLWTHGDMAQKRHRQRYSAQCSAGKWLLIGDPQTFWSWRVLGPKIKFEIVHTRFRVSWEGSCHKFRSSWSPNGVQPFSQRQGQSDQMSPDESGYFLIGMIPFIMIYALVRQWNRSLFSPSEAATPSTAEPVGSSAWLWLDLKQLQR